MGILIVIKKGLLSPLAQYLFIPNLEPSLSKPEKKKNASISWKEKMDRTLHGIFRPTYKSSSMKLKIDFSSPQKLGIEASSECTFKPNSTFALSKPNNTLWREIMFQDYKPVFGDYKCEFKHILIFLKMLSISLKLYQETTSLVLCFSLKF
jgi:hypothetical protein